MQFINAGTAIPASVSTIPRVASKTNMQYSPLLPRICRVIDATAVVIAMIVSYGKEVDISSVNKGLNDSWILGERCYTIFVKTLALIPMKSKYF